MIVPHIFEKKEKERWSSIAFLFLANIYSVQTASEI